MQSMFMRLMTVFLVVIIACVSVVTVIYYNISRESFDNSTYNYLISQAETLVRLAEVTGYNGRNTSYNRYYEEIADGLRRDYNAYCLVSGRDRQIQSLSVEADQLMNEKLRQTQNFDYLSPALDAALDGQPFRNPLVTQSGTMFTVAVPQWQNNTVNRVFIIQTDAQDVHSSFLKTIWPVLLVSAISILVSAVVIFILTRSIVRPLTQMEHAANALAEGDFTVRTAETGGRETQALAHAFNGMAVQLEELENSRREFLANVSHELRSPITSIQGYMQSMLDGTIPQTDMKQYMETVVNETRRLSKLINSLLNLSRMERDEVKLALSHFDLNEMTRRVIITKIQQIEDNEIELNVDFAQDPCYVHADADQITQVLVNLIDNALKFTPKGGELSIRSRIEKNLVYVTIQDNGESISPEDAPHLFDRFYKADKAHTVGKGTGLGLAICKRIMEKHGQKIYLVPVEQGAAFEFTLEKGEAPAQPAAAERTEES